jgi:hypothetical protein
MVSSVNSVIPHTNFLPSNLPPDPTSQAFYNSELFAQNEKGFLSSQLSMDDRAQKKGLQEIKDSITGVY